MRLTSESSNIAFWAFLLLSGSQVASAASAILGIDLGQEFIKAALVKPGIPLEIVLTKDTKRKEASAIGFKPARSEGGDEYTYPERLYGTDAVNLAARFPADVYPNLKQLLGAHVFDDRVMTYSARYPALNMLPSDFRPTVAFRSESSPPARSEDGATLAGDGSFQVEELLAMQLTNIVKNAESMAGSGTTIRDVVFTTPAFFSAEEKYTLKLAAEIAGLKVMTFISDGLAVALNYATGRQFPVDEPAEKHIIYDMGAGSTTATIVEFNGKSVKDIGKFNKTIVEVNVLGVGYDRSLGGDLFNQKITNHLLQEFLDVKGKKVDDDPLQAKEAVRLNGRFAAKLWKEASRVRHILSANTETQASVESLYNDIDFRSKKLTRAAYEEMLAEYSQRVLDPIHNALSAAGLTLEDVNSVIVHGGGVRAPFVKNLLAEFVTEGKVRTNVNSDEAAVLGATFRGAALSISFRVKEFRIQDRAVHGIAAKYKREGIEKETTQALFSANSKLGIEKVLPIRRTTDFSIYLTNLLPPRPPNLEKVIDEPIIQVITKNLTETTKKLHENFKCTAEHIRTEFGVKLSEKDGLPEIVSTWAGCDVEYEDIPEWKDEKPKDGETEEKKDGSGGIVDDVKGFFGLGKKKDGTDQIVLEGEKASSSSAESSVTEAPKAEESSNAEPAAVPSITFSLDKGEKPNLFPENMGKRILKVFEKIPIEVEVIKAGFNPMPEEIKTMLINKRKGFDIHDASRIQREEARNKLESFIYKLREWTSSDEDFIAASPSTILSDLKKKVDELGNWIYEDGESASMKTLKEKLKELTDLEGPISKRREENKGREDKIKLLRDAIDQNKQFVQLMQETTKLAEQQAAKKAKEREEKRKSKAAAASSAAEAASSASSASSSPSAETSATSPDDLDDDPVAVPPTEKEKESKAEEADEDEEEDPTPDPSSTYTATEISTLTSAYESVSKWLDEKLAAQKSLALHDDPAILVRDIDGKLMEMNSKLMEILERKMPKGQRGGQGGEKKGKGKGKEKSKPKKKTEKKAEKKEEAKKEKKHDEL